MPLTASAQYHLAFDLDTIGRWSPLLPIDTTRRTSIADSTIHPPMTSTPPCDMEALDHSQRITLAEAVIASTTEYWLADQPGFVLPPQLTAADNQTLETTAARCLTLAHNIAILAQHPNIDQIAYDIARGSTSIQWARDNHRLADPDDQDTPPQTAHHQAPVRPILFTSDYTDDTEPGTPAQTCPYCHLQLPGTGICDCCGDSEHPCQHRILPAT